MHDRVTSCKENIDTMRNDNITNTWSGWVSSRTGITRRPAGLMLPVRRSLVTGVRANLDSMESTLFSSMISYTLIHFSIVSYGFWFPRKREIPSADFRPESRRVIFKYSFSSSSLFSTKMITISPRLSCRSPNHLAKEVFTNDKNDKSPPLSTWKDSSLSSHAEPLPRDGGIIWGDMHLPMVLCENPNKARSLPDPGIQSVVSVLAGLHQSLAHQDRKLKSLAALSKLTQSTPRRQA